MTSEAEASATIEAFQTVLEREARKPEFEPLPSADPAARAAWIKGLMVRERWPMREALLWVASRVLDDMADIVLTSLWRDDDRDIGPPGLVWVLGHIHAWRDDRTFVSATPESELMQALQLGRVQASGLFEDREQRRNIERFHWEDLKFGNCPGPRPSGSAAHRKAQVHGIAWSGHWTDLLFERDGLLETFGARSGVAVGLTEEQAEAVIRAAVKENGGFISQDKGAAAVFSLDANFTRARARKLTQKVTGNGKPGPKSLTHKGWLAFRL